MTIHTNFLLYALFCKKVQNFITDLDNKSIAKKNAYFCINITYSHLFFHLWSIQINIRLYALLSKRVQKGQNYKNTLGSKIDSKEKFRFLHINHFLPFVFPFFQPSDYFWLYTLLWKKVQNGWKLTDDDRRWKDRREGLN